jgi:TetR/AcrR family tetracycline transcriptional repressor
LTRSLLNAEEIFRAALRLVDSEGLEALTMRSLAAELGVAAMTLYGHVATKEDLLLGVVNLVTREIGLPDPGTPPWEALRSVTREFRRVSLLHPNLVPLIMRQPPTGLEGLLTLEAAFDALRRAGIPAAQTARAYRVTASYAIGFVSLECGGYFQPVDVAAGDRIAPVDPSAIPRIIEMAPYLAEWDADAEFENGMDLLIDVLSSWADSSPPGQVVEGDGGRGGNVERVHAATHGDADTAIGGP